MSSDNPLSFSEHLLKRFDEDMLKVHAQMNSLEIVFDNPRVFARGQALKGLGLP